MKQALIALCLTFTTTFTAAQTPPPPAAPTAATPTAPYMAEGEVRKIDKEQSKITLRHGEIKQLDMPAMTMVFKLKEPQMIEQLVEGSKVKFDTERIGGVWTVTRVEAVK